MVQWWSFWAKMNWPNKHTAWVDTLTIHSSHSFISVERSNTSTVPSSVERSNTSTAPSSVERSTTMYVPPHYPRGLSQRACPVQHTTKLIASSSCGYDLWLSKNQRFLFCTWYKFVLMCLAFMTNIHTFPSNARPNCSGHQAIFLHHCNLDTYETTQQRDQQLFCHAR